MAGRFVFQELASGMPRSTGRLGASSWATSPANPRALEDVFAAIHPRTVLPSSTHGLHGLAGGGIGTLRNLFCAAAVRPGMVVPSKREILSGCGARCLNTVTAKTGRSTNGMPSRIKDRFHEQNMKIIKLQNQLEVTKADLEVLRANIKADIVKGQTTVLKYGIIILGAGVVGQLLAEWVAS